MDIIYMDIISDHYSNKNQVIQYQRKGRVVARMWNLEAPSIFKQMPWENQQD